MNIYVWNNFTKRKNSTLQPANGTLKQVVLKEDTSISNPTFIINEPLPSYTYVSAFGNYYFVTDITNLSANQSAISCAIDVLATYRSTILNYNAFVERSASNFDSLVIDPLLSSRQVVSSVERASRSVDYFSTQGAFVVQAFSKGGGVVLYATPDMTPYEKILDTNTYTASDITEWIDKKVAQAFDLDVYIGAVKWLPISYTHIGTALGTQPFYIGPVDIGVPSGYSVHKSDQRTPIGTQVIYDIPIPTSNAYGDFRDYSPRFSKYRMRLAGVGFVELDPVMIGTILNSSDTLTDNMYIDYITGDITHYIMKRSVSGAGERNVEIGRFNGNISVNIPIAKSSPDTSGAFSNLANRVGQGAFVGGGYGAIAGAVIGLVEAVGMELTPETSFMGSTAENMALIRYESQSIVTIAEKYGSKEFATSVAGRPLMQNVRLGSLSGFCKCGNASVPVNARDEERVEINSYLNSGVYIE